AEFERVQEFAENRTDGNTALTIIGVLGGIAFCSTVGSLSAVRDVHFDRITALGCAYDRILRRLLSVINPRFAILVEIAHLRAVFLHPHGLALFAALVTAGGDHTVSVRIDRVVVV